ncbi:hypothetical protein HDU81_002747 [Chytriomyces hyalinus]|nr:hypothetical protein HDU81_002747 [Chytriomyces hyalinus]
MSKHDPTNVASLTIAQTPPRYPKELFGLDRRRSIDTLPIEVLHQILRWLHPRKIFHIRRVSHTFYACTSTKHFAASNLALYISLQPDKETYLRDLGGVGNQSPTAQQPEREVPCVSPATGITIIYEEKTHNSPCWLDEAFFHMPDQYKAVFAETYLKHVENLEWGENDTFLEAPIPQMAIGLLKNLVRLNLNDCGITGTIPVELTTLVKLECLSLYENELVGPIPPQLSLLVNLNELYLGRNRLSGTIPPSLGELTGLKMLNLGPNELVGEIPGELGRLVNLKELFLGGNQLTGHIPVELCKLVNILDLFLHKNQLTGPVPPEIGELVNLRCVYFEENQLSGEIPVEVLKLVRLEDCDMRNNQLTCSFPCPPLIQF